MALFGKKEDPELVEARQSLDASQAHIVQLQSWVHQLRGQEAPAREAELRNLIAAIKDASLRNERVQEELSLAQAAHHSWSARVAETREQAILQEVGVYEYAHPLEDALAFKDALADLKDQIKAAAKSDAVSCHVDWAINGSVREGQKMGRDIAKLMLRAYNTEADNAVRSVKPHTRDSIKNRLSKSRETIGKLGTVLQISISQDYHRLRLKEIDLTADYLMKVEIEKEALRAEKERLREEAKVMKEVERERTRLAKERASYQAAAAKLVAGNGDDASKAAIEAKIAELDAAMASVETRAANVRCGFVYVISNVGAFGPDVVKIGLTRRLEPMDRVRELGDASVPFRFDVHALFFSDDAVALENQLHQRFSDRRVNLVNMRREFFYATPAEVRDALVELGNDHVLEFNEEVEAIEWRASEPRRRSEVDHHGTEPEPTDPRFPAPTPSPTLATAALRASAGSGAWDGDLSDDGDA